MTDQELREYSHDLLRDIMQLMMKRSNFEDVTLKLCHAMVALDKVAIDGDLAQDVEDVLKAHSVQ